jgi:hypothetical protein
MMTLVTTENGRRVQRTLDNLKLPGGQLAHELDGGKLYRRLVALDVADINIREAQWSGNKEHVLTLLHVLHRFLITHPEARPSEHPWSNRF